MARYAQDGIEDEGPALRAHIRHAHQPQEKTALRFGRLAEIWTAMSIGIMMIAVVLLVVFTRRFIVVGLGGLLLVMITIESAFRRRLANLIRWIAIFLAIAGILVLLYQFFWFLLTAAVLITGLYIIISNLRELFARR
jgi:predicted membrane protein